MERTVRAGRKNEPSIVAASGRFGGFTPETERNIRETVVVKDAKLIELLDLFRSIKFGIHWNADEKFGYLEPLARGHHVSSVDIAKFSLALVELAGEELFDVKAGLLLSALINNSPEERFSVFTSHLECYPSFFAYRNTKHIEVNGPLSGDAGWSMDGGSLLVKGDVRGDLGSSIRNGSIIVEGDVWAGTGTSMHGGIIEVKGNALGTVGDGMDDGEIRLWKKYLEVGVNFRNGKIFNHGKLIAGK